MRKKDEAPRKGKRKVLFLIVAVLLLLPLIVLATFHAPAPGWTSNDITTGQHPGYPDLVPHVYDMSVEHTTMFAAEAARRLGWEVKRTDPTVGEMQAVAPALIPTFKDDVNVTVAPLPENPRHTVVTIRVHSRVTVGNLGAPASHIRALQSNMDDKLPRVQ